MSGTKTGGLKTVQTNKAKYGKDYYQRIGARGGRSGTGHAFAHGKVSPRDAGKLGGRPGGFTMPAAQRQRHSQMMKAYWIERKQREQVFVPDDTSFGDGFFGPTWKQRLMKRMMK